MLAHARTSSIEHVFVKRVLVKHVFVKHVFVKHVFVKHVFVKHVFVNDFSAILLLLLTCASGCGITRALI